MTDFAHRTGLMSPGENRSRRYLWTDAFALCNYLALFQLTGDKKYVDLAMRLVEQVHAVLGRHRLENARRGPLSGLDERESARHPTAGGLRIGKKLPERAPGEPEDEQLEWDRDGQYYHYLTKWMHALCRMGSVTKSPECIRWAAELAERSNTAFIYQGADGSKRMYWKMSIDLSRPQVRSMGHHDPLDGLITTMQVGTLCRRISASRCPDLAAGRADLAEMCRSVDWATTDPLGLGTLLADALRLAQLRSLAEPSPLPGLLPDMLGAAVLGLAIFAKDDSLQHPAAFRLAFRELGLAIGLQALTRLETYLDRNPEIFGSGSVPVASLFSNLRQYQPLREQILHFWLNRDNHQFSSWTEHEDINSVMLATCLVPGGFLGNGEYPG